MRIATPRSAGGVLGGFIGAIIMSVVAGILVTVAVTPVVAMSGIVANTAIGIFEDLPSHLNPGQLAQPSTIYAKKGDKKVKIADFYAQNRVMVGWDKIPQYVKDAAVAAEDPRFYTHGGVDILGVGRATLGELSGNEAGGASTITMQYVRNVQIQEAEAITDPEEHDAAYEEATKRSADRKLREMRYAISIEKEYSKDQILLGYLNIALFGRTVYGIEAAAQYYYGKKATDLTLAESASLMAIVYWPTRMQIDIKDNIPANTDRRNWILERMLDASKITQQQYDEAVATEVVPKITPRYSGCAMAETKKYRLGHFCDYVQRYIENDKAFGETAEERNAKLLRGGLKIMTTIDLDIQRAGVESMRAHAPAQYPGINLGAASVSVKVGTGAVLAMVQNRPFSDDPTFLKKNKKYTSVNYNTDYEYGGSNGFQVGSTFKPITLAEWLRTGHSVREIVNVNGRTVPLESFRASCLGGVYGSGPFKFSNDNLGVRGSQTVLTGIAQSLNGAVVSMQQKLDLCDTIKMAQDLGIHRASDQPVWTKADYKSKEIGKSMIGKIKNPTLNGNPRDLTMVPSNVYAGVDEIAPITMASAFAAFAGGGKVCTPVPIASITDHQGENVEFTKSKCRNAISKDVAAGVAYVLKFAVENVGFVGHARSSMGIPHLAKTGTTDDTLDNWTVGASTKVATATWLGNAGPYCYTKSDCRRVSTYAVGGGYNGLMAADQFIWPAMMNVADRKYGGDAFPEPSSDALKQTMAMVPDVRGMSFDEAKRVLEAAGFSVEDGGRTNSELPEGQVAETNPAGGSTVPAGSMIVIQRSNGKLSPLPNVVGLGYAEAVSTLQGAGFGSIDAQCVQGGSGGSDPSTPSSPQAGDVVKSMSPGAGKNVKRSQTVTLAVACT
ncbi:MAG: transglycosylase domain-containing protein [Leucobacter sp.]|nr:transglycosylase domain-containing protein [Leucobacter sp.]